MKWGIISNPVVFYTRVLSVSLYAVSFYSLETLMIGLEDGDFAYATDGDSWFGIKNKMLENISFSIALEVYSSISPFCIL